MPRNRKGYHWDKRWVVVEWPIIQFSSEDETEAWEFAQYHKDDMEYGELYILVKDKEAENA